MRIILAILLIILFAIVLAAPMASAQCGPRGCGPGTVQVKAKPAQHPHPAIVKVVCELNGSTDIGTGTIVRAENGTAHVLTCWHILKDFWPRGRVTVICCGKRYTAEVLKIDKIWDVALLGIADPGVGHIRIAERLPVKGDSLWTYGLRTGIQRGAFGRWYAPRQSSDYQLIGLTKARVHSGDSGGAIVNRHGRLVGVISGGSSELACVGTCFPRIRRILRGVLPPYPNRPGWVIPKRPRRVVPIAPPPRIAPVAPEPQTMPNPQPQPPALLVALEARIALLEQKLLQPGPPGPPGREGPLGPPGPSGPPGLDATPAFYTITPRKPKGI